MKKALQLKDRKVLRCSGISAQADGEKIKLSYHDEDGDIVKETFYFSNNKQRQRFYNIFSRTITGSAITATTAEQIVTNIQQLVAPDFVIAKKEKYFWKIEHRIFDYKGNYRKANQQ